MTLPKVAATWPRSNPSSASSRRAPSDSATRRSDSRSRLASATSACACWLRLWLARCSNWKPVRRFCSACCSLAATARTASCARCCWACAASRETRRLRRGVFQEAALRLQLAGEHAKLLARLLEVVAAGGDARGELGDAVGVGGHARGDALQLDGGVVGLRASLADLLVELVALLDPGGVLGVHRVDGGGLLGDLRGEDGDLRGDGGLLGVELAHAAGQHDAQAGAQVVAQQAVTLRLGGLALERVHLARDLVEDVVDAREVDLGGLQAQLGEALLGLEAGDSGGLFEDGAAVHGLGAEDLADALLADDGVGLAAQAGAHEDVLNVAQAADLAVEQVLGVAGAEEAAGDGDLTGADRGAAKLAAANLQDDPGGRRLLRPRRAAGSSVVLALVELVAVQLPASTTLPSMPMTTPGCASRTASSVSSAFCWRSRASSQSPARSRARVRWSHRSTSRRRPRRAGQRRRRPRDRPG